MNLIVTLHFHPDDVNLHFIVTMKDISGTSKSISYEM